MGVTGLWKLIECSGKPVPVETLENKVLAVDISIWLHQVVKGYQDNKGGQVHNAHIIGLFNRICKLLYYRIKPIFVFDGHTCQLKLQTIRKRSQQKSKIHTEAERIEKLLMESLAKEQVLKEKLAAAIALESPSKKVKPAVSDSKDEIFMLPPPIAENVKLELLKKEEDDEFSCPKKSYSKNITSIDVTSSYFKSLPADKRHDILMDIKETRKQSSWGRMKDLPVESNDFSKFQMEGLLKRRNVQVSLEEAEKEMGGKTWSLAELESLLTEEGVIESSKKYAQKIAADENIKILLVRDIAKAIYDAKEEALQQPCTSKQADLKDEALLGDEYDLELQRAIQLSLGHDIEEQVEEQEPVEAPIKLNPHQRKKFGATVQTHGLVRGFMMEYGQMNDDDLHDMANETQVAKKDNLNDSWSEKFPNTDRYVLYGTQENDDDDKPINEETKVVKSSHEIVIKVDSKMSQEDDLFADIFKSQAVVDLTEIEKVNVPDVEVASIGSSSDDDTVEYEIPEKVNNFKDTESGFVSEEGKELPIIESSSEEKQNEIPLSENDKFWGFLNDDEEESAPTIPKEPSMKNADAKIIHVMSSPIKMHPASMIPKEPVIENVNDTKVVNVLSSPIKMHAGDDVKESDLTTVEIDEVQIIAGKSPEKVNAVEDDDEDVEIIPDKSPEKAHNVEEKDKVPMIIKESLVIDLENDDDEIFVADRSPVKMHEILESENWPEHNDKVSEPQIINLEKTPEKSPTIIQASQNKDLSFEEQQEIEDALKAFEQDFTKELEKDYTKEELEQMQGDTKKQTIDFAQERNKLNRMGTSITQQMQADCKKLLRLFGIPYIKSPTEAEAQCAFLNDIGMIDGIISDDSDVWLFGAKTVYKNFFVQKKNVKEFQVDNLKEMFHLDRIKLIQLAMLVGSDYTLGLLGVGAVTALEILAAFPETPEMEGETDQYQSLLSSLRKFRDWFNNGKDSGPGGKTALKSKLKNVEIIEGFPSMDVMRAYLEPKIDTSTEPFSWGTPDHESLVEYTKDKLGWTRFKTEEILMPVLKRLNEKKQTTIKDYFKAQLTKKVFDNQKMSKRVQKAVGKIGGGEEEEEEKKVEKKTRKRKPTSKAAKKKLNEEEEKEKKAIEELVLSSDDDDDMKPPVAKKSSPSPPAKPNAFNLLKQPEPPKAKSPKKPGSLLTRKRKAKTNDPQPSTSTADVLPPKRAPRIPETKQVIPQKERAKKEMNDNKQKAIDILKKQKSKK